MKQQNQQKGKTEKVFNCCITGEVIPLERVEYLLSENIPENLMTSMRGAELTHRSRKIIVVDDEGSQFVCDKIDNTRVYEAERFGNDSAEDFDSPECNIYGRRTIKKVEDTISVLGHESLDAYIKKQDTGEEESDAL